MKIDILTLFPGMFTGPFSESMIKSAQEKSLAEISIHNLRKWGIDERKTVDDRPYGGGMGMVLMIEPIHKALEELEKNKQGNSKTILLTPQGRKFDQNKARELAKLDHLILIAGHYEGFDERIREHLVDEEISIGDYVLTGGEIPAMVITDSVVRLIPGVLETEATEYETFSPLKTNDLVLESSIEYPQYTRPANYNDWKVPDILLTGDHKKIESWRAEESKNRTKLRRPDLIK